VEAPAGDDVQPPRRRSRAWLVAALLAVPALAVAAYVALSKEQGAPRAKRPPPPGDVSVLPADAPEVSVLTVDANASVARVDAAAARVDATGAVVAVADAAAAHADAGAGLVVVTDASRGVADAGHAAMDAAVVAIADASRPVVDAAVPETKDEIAKADAAKAREAMARQDYQAALTAAEAALHAEPNNYGLHELATRAACRAGKPEVAHAHAATLLPRDRRNALRGCPLARNRFGDEEDH